MDKSMETQSEFVHDGFLAPAIIEERWDDLTLADHVVFGSVMMRPDLCKRLIELAIQVPVEKIEYIQSERDVHPIPGTPGVRLDVYAGDGTGRVFNVELQRRDERHLPQRARFYQASISYEMLDKARRKLRKEGRALTWKERYKALKESYVIFICMDDPFDRGWKRYVFKNTSAGDSTLGLGDGTCEVFLNAAWTKSGKDDGDKSVQKELEALLAYLIGEYDGDDEFIRALDEEVHSIIARPDWRKNVMFWSEYYEQLAQEAEEVGMRKGRAQQTALISQLANALQEVGRSNDLLPALHDQEKLDRLCREFELIK